MTVTLQLCLSSYTAPGELPSHSVTGWDVGSPGVVEELADVTASLRSVHHQA